MEAQTVQINDDPWAVADSAKPRDYEYYGQVKADAWFGYFPGGGAKPIPFDPSQHPTDKRATLIDIQIIPIPQQDARWDIRQSYTDFSPDWTKITLPSIKALGVDGLKALNNKYVRVANVQGKRKKKDDSGAETGDFYTTFKFIEVFPDEAACVTAYAGAAPAHIEQPPANPADEKAVALQFAEVVVANIARGKTDHALVVAEVTTAIAGMPMISKHFTGQSSEIQALIDKAMSHANAS